MLAPLKRLVGRGRTAVRSIANPLLIRRRFQACCCGLSKSGTHSMSALFHRCRTAHHPDAGPRLELAMRFLRGEVDVHTASAWLRRRDRTLWLEMESSTLAGILIEAMVLAFPERKFFLTLRDPVSWCDSWLDHNLNDPPDPTSGFARLDRLRLGVTEIEPSPHDRPLLQRGQHPLACYLQLWREHNRTVLDTVPEERLMIVRTPEIIEAIPTMAAWLGIDPGLLDPERGWAFKAPTKHRLMSELDPAYVEDLVGRYCSELIERVAHLTGPGENPPPADPVG